MHSLPSETVHRTPLLAHYSYCLCCPSWIKKIMSITASKFVTEGEKKTCSSGNYEPQHMFRVLSTGGEGGILPQTLQLLPQNFCQLNLTKSSS